MAGKPHALDERVLKVRVRGQLDVFGAGEHGIEDAPAAGDGQEEHACASALVPGGKDFAARGKMRE